MQKNLAKSKPPMVNPWTSNEKIAVNLGVLPELSPNPKEAGADEHKKPEKKKHQEGKN